MVNHLQDDVSLLGANHVGDVARLHGESFFFQRRGQLPTLEAAESAAIGCGGSVGIFLGDVLESGAISNLLKQIGGLGFSNAERSGFGSLTGGIVYGWLRVCGSSIRIGRGWWSGRRRRSNRFWRNQNFFQANGFGLLHIAFMFVVELLLFFFVQGQVAADFLANHLLGDDLVPHILLEVFPGNSLFGRFLFEIFHAGELHLLAHLVEALDEVGVAGDAKILTLVDKKLLVDQVAENVLLTVGISFVGVGRFLLFYFVLELVFTADKLSAGDDLVVDAGDDLFNDLPGRQNGQAGQSNKNYGEFAHKGFTGPHSAHKRNQLKAAWIEPILLLIE